MIIKLFPYFPTILITFLFGSVMQLCVLRELEMDILPIPATR